MAEPIKLEIDLDLNAHLARHGGYDEEGEPVSSPITVEDIVLGLAAEKLLVRLARDSKYAFDRRIADIRDEEIRAALRPVIEEALTRSVQPTDPYGNPKGEATTLAEVITATATKMLTAKEQSGFGKPERTLVQQLIAEGLDYRFKAELAKELEAGKEEVRKVLRQQGAEIIEKAIEKGAGRG